MEREAQQRAGEYRSFPMRSVRPTHDGRSMAEGDIGNRSADSESTLRPAESTAADTSAGGNPATSRAHTPLRQPQRMDSPRLASPDTNTSRAGSAPRTRPQQPAPHPVINLENFEKFQKLNLKTVFNSPRSLHVCAEHGIHATELLPRAPQEFLSLAVPETIAAMRYHHFESRRQEKLALLRAARADCIHEAAAAAASSTTGRVEDEIREHTGPGASVPVRTARTGASTPPATTQRPVRSARPLLSDGPNSRQKDPTVLVERSTRRDLVYERAMKLRLEKEQRVIQNQIVAEQRAAAHRRACEEEKIRVIELRRLKWGDAREDIEHKRRQREYLERQRREAYTAANGPSTAPSYYRRSASAQNLVGKSGSSRSSLSGGQRTSTMIAEPSTTADVSCASAVQQRQQQRWEVQLAKEEYFTPRQRAEKVRRAASAHAA